MRGPLTFIVMVCLCAGTTGPAFTAEQVAQPPPGEDENVVTNVKIAPAPELRDDEEATRLLGIKLVELRRKLQAAGLTGPRSEEKRKVPRAALKELASFAQDHPKSKAALVAKFLMGDLIFQGMPGVETGACRECYEDMVRNYPNTQEAALAKLDLLALSLQDAQYKELTPVEGKAPDPAPKLRCAAELMDALKAALPLAKQIEEDQSKLAIVFKTFDRGTPNGKFVPGIRLDIAALTELMGRREEARRLYEAMIRDYPGTGTADSAKRALESMTIEDELRKEGIDLQQ